MNERKQYKSLDVVKFISALLIIIIHTAPFATYSKALTFGFRNIVCVIAVPFFFFTSGFLAFKKLNALDESKRKEYIKSYLSRVAIMYFIWSAVYFIFVCIKWSRNGFSIYSVLEYIKDFFFEGSYSTIWYLPALFSATLFVYLLKKILSYKQILILSLVVYLFTLGGSSYYGLVTNLPFIKGVYDLYYSFFDTIKNGLLFGMLFVSLGAYVCENEDNITAGAKGIKAFVPVVLFGIVLAIEEFVIAYFGWNSKGVDTVISLIPFTYFLAKFLLVTEFKVKDNICVKMRKYSILMFLTQRIPISIIDFFFSNTLVATNSILNFITVLATTMLISFAILKLSEKFKILKKAY